LEWKIDRRNKKKFEGVKGKNILAWDDVTDWTGAGLSFPQWKLFAKYHNLLAQNQGVSQDQLDSIKQEISILKLVVKMSYDMRRDKSISEGTLSKSEKINIRKQIKQSACEKYFGKDEPYCMICQSKIGILNVHLVPLFDTTKSATHLFDDNKYTKPFNVQSWRNTIFLCNDHRMLYDLGEIIFLKEDPLKLDSPFVVTYRGSYLKEKQEVKVEEEKSLYSIEQCKNEENLLKIKINEKNAEISDKHKDWKLFEAQHKNETLKNGKNILHFQKLGNEAFKELSAKRAEYNDLLAEKKKYGI